MFLISDGEGKNDNKKGGGKKAGDKGKPEKPSTAKSKPSDKKVMNRPSTLTTAILNRQCVSFVILLYLCLFLEMIYREERIAWLVFLRKDLSLTSTLYDVSLSVALEDDT